MRVWHPLFKWGTVMLPNMSPNGISNVEFDFKSITYYIMGKGYVTYSKFHDQGNRVTVPNRELFEKELKNEELPDNWPLRLKGYNPTIIL